MGTGLIRVWAVCAGAASTTQWDNTPLTRLAGADERRLISAEDGRGRGAPGFLFRLARLLCMV
jgi:hypothetical protein